jgi:uncharacterized membrane protein YdjX (TVP38/TMEM64 family)/phosphatidylglycerophosphate synthase
MKRAVALMGVALAAGLVFLGRDLPLRAGLEAVITGLRAAGPWAFFGAMAVLPAPLAWFTVPAGEAFAPQLTLAGVVGAALVAVGVNIALHYFLARYALRPWLSAVVARWGYQVPSVTAGNALEVVLLVRLTPGPPLCLGCWVLGIAEAPFRLYLIVSWLITVPWILGGVVLGRGILGGDIKLAAAGLAVLAMAIVTVRWLRQRRRMISRAAPLALGPTGPLPATGLSGAGESLPPYVYCCVDHSALTAWIARVVAQPVERMLPPTWSANTVTGLGSGLMWGLLAGVLLMPAGVRDRFGWLWALLLGGYCVLDHVDGCRARRLGTSGAWGEYLDHALDAWHGAIMVVAMASVSYPAVRPGVTAVTLAGAGIATVATWLDQKWRSEIHLGRIGPVEAVGVACLYLLSWVLPAASVWWGSAVWAGSDVTRAEAFLLIGAGGGLASAFAALRRSPGQAGRLGAFTVAAGVLVGSGYGGAPWWSVWFAVTWLIVDATARILWSHLARKTAPWPDWVAALLGVTGAAVWPEGSAVTTAVMVVWLSGRVGAAWWQAAMTLRPVPPSRG